MGACDFFYLAKRAKVAAWTKRSHSRNTAAALPLSEAKRKARKKQNRAEQTLGFRDTSETTAITCKTIKINENNAFQARFANLNSYSL
jgi:hypothetical protein